MSVKGVVAIVQVAHLEQIAIACIAILSAGQYGIADSIDVSPHRYGYVNCMLVLMCTLTLRSIQTTTLYIGPNKYRHSVVN